MYVLILDNQIAGTVSNPQEAPDMFQVVQIDYSGDIGNLYYDGTSVLERPGKPSELAYWNSSTNSWQVPDSYQAPQIEKLTQHELAPILYSILASVHPAIAECLTYLLAVNSGDNTTSEQMYSRLMERCIDERDKTDNN